MQDHQIGHVHADQLPDQLRAVGPGWHPLLLRLHTQLLVCHADYRVEDLKEKLGGVRVRIAATPGQLDPEARGLILSAEEEAATVCEFCGATGRRRCHGDTPYGWIKTVCEPCHAAWSSHTIMIINGDVSRRP